MSFRTSIWLDTLFLGYFLSFFPFFIKRFLLYVSGCLDSLWKKTVSTPSNTVHRKKDVLGMALEAEAVFCSQAFSHSFPLLLSTGNL